ncbi:fungal-specific transcription factor domain-containing protein, partial [Crassisporium funariophilum]
MQEQENKGKSRRATPTAISIAISLSHFILLVQCDSKHPKCTACTTAGTGCHQEDRHRQTLTPRGHTEHLEHQLAQCEALIKRQIPGFSLENLKDVLVREGIDPATIAPVAPSPIFQMDGMKDFRNDGGPPPQQQPKGYPPMYHPGPHMMHPPYPPMMPGYGPPGPYMAMQGPPGAYNPHMHPPFQPGVPYPPPHMMHHQPPPEQQAQQPPPPPPPPMPASILRSVVPPTKGTDPNGHDMSTAQALAKNFGVSPAITSGLKLDAVSEDLPVGPSALPKVEEPSPRDASQWITISVDRKGGTPNTLSIYGPVSKSPTVEVWLPKDRKMANHIVEVYFSRLNFHRPVFSRQDFDKILSDLYEGVTPIHDPGHIFSIYIIFGLGTLSELNHRAVKADLENKAEVLQHLGSAVAKKLMPPDWPEHNEFFERALAVKPDLRVSISSLQALILLHWYLYTERQGRTLWRLAGSLVRLAVELGLHHDPTPQFHPITNQPIFTEEESQLRIRLWGIILIHDRGTSILLGRPLAISPSDSNTPHPSRPKNIRFAEFSEHFELSQPVADFQADIINSLYAPSRQAGDTIIRNATRIIKSMVEFRRGLPERYKYYFSGTAEWPLDKRSKLVQDITEDEGLTLLKIGIARILMLRALFSSKELSYAHKHKALVDAIITSHNVIIVHSQLIRFPDIAFFTSPIPLHIAAMVILYGHISKVECLPPSIALEDVWMALDMLPRFRWRWERKDVNGGHPLIAKLVEHVMGVNLHTITLTGLPFLIPEPDWDEPMSPTPKSQQSTPIMSSTPSAYTPSSGPPVYGPQPRSLNGTSSAINRSNSGGSTPPDKHLADVPTPLFYPFWPENQAAIHASAPGGTSGPANGTHHQDYSQILRAAAAAQDEYSGQSSQYVSGERDSPHGVQPQDVVWVSMQSSRNISNYSGPPQP